MSDKAIKTADLKYTHVQRGRTIVIALLLGSMNLIVMGIAFRIYSLLIVAGVLSVVGILFSSMTIELCSRRLQWRIGPGVISKSISIDEIASARAVKTSWIDGWGVHYTRFGWLYNIAGTDAVAITLKNGKKLALGTDEPQELITRLGLP